MSKKIRVGIVGGAGYTGGELIRLLIYHPNVEIAYVHSKSNAGNKIYAVHTDLAGDTDLEFAENIHFDIDVLFLCMGHGESKKFFVANAIELNNALPFKIIDLSQDFRPETDGFVYGLPELNLKKISVSNKVANPGCFATAIQLALLPLAHHRLIHSDIHVCAITGSSGAGQALSDSVHFTWRSNNISIYKPFVHQHLAEITRSISGLQSNFAYNINFIPYRGNFTRGIMASVYTKFEDNIDEATKLYEAYYANAPFTHLVSENPDLKQVVNTNKCLLYLEKHGDNLLIISTEDNLLKGASGQAVQNMNLMFGFEQTAGLLLKPSAY